ncbi:unnamed protein product [Prunus armeniaca]
MSRAPLLSTPLPRESLILFLSISAIALSSVLIRKPKGRRASVPQLEKLAYALVLLARKLRPYFQAHAITVLTNQPIAPSFAETRDIGKARLIKWAIELEEFDIHYHPCPAEKGQAVADFIS